jgi:hypothetical protein
MTAISIPNTFTPLTTISSSQMNANFTAVAAAFGISLGIAAAETLTGALKAADGAAAAPGYTFGSDTNTGFYKKATDSIGAATAGVERWYIDAAGKVFMLGSIDVATGIELGHASDTTITRASAGVIAVEGNNVIMATTLATESASGIVDMATEAEIYSAASGAHALMAADLETAAAGVALTDAATVAVDWDTGINFTLTVTANRAIGNPTNGQPGTWRTILVQGNDTTDRTLSFGNQFLGELPTITDCDSGRWYLLLIHCVSATHFTVSSKKANGT